MPSIQKLLIANRGEIACRILETAHGLGIATVAVYSDADSDALHVARADEAVHIGPADARLSYLNMEKILDAARRTGADAVHPGYGFLSESAAFATACAQAGLTFVGPSALAIETMGDKARSKATMEAAGVPTIPGFRWENQDEMDSATLELEADRVGYPLLVKATLGGGGRGLRRVHERSELADALATARSEAQSAFGCGDLLLERLLEGARHVEIQVMADAQGEVIHLGERDCSLQRRHQKVIEEAPCPSLSPELREAMGQAACDAARAVSYQGAGTVEFLLDAQGGFFFLEMNTRLQVEHPVTELISDLDLVELQLRLASGEPLSLAQEDIELRGHAMEARLYAEDPERGFLPQCGVVHRWEPPQGEGVRVDHGLREGQAITPHYDAMVAKIITWGVDREEARLRLLRALAQTTLLGVTHNGPFLQQLLKHETFVAGAATTDLLERAFSSPEVPLPGDHLAIAAALWIGERVAGRAWHLAGGATSHLQLETAGEASALKIEHGEGPMTVWAHGQSHRVRVVHWGERGLTRVDVEGVQRSVSFVRVGAVLHLDCGAGSRAYREHQPGAEEIAGSGTTVAPMSGKVLAVHVAPGDSVSPGDALMTLEAMKLETKLQAQVAGVVAEVRAREGDQVQGGAILVLLQQDEERRS